jgi:hypothetical protein
VYDSFLQRIFEIIEFECVDDEIRLSRLLLSRADFTTDQKHEETSVSKLILLYPCNIKDLELILPRFKRPMIFEGFLTSLVNGKAGPPLQEVKIAKKQ